MANYSFCSLLPGQKATPPKEVVEHPQLQEVYGFWDVACISPMLKKAQAEVILNFKGYGFIDVLCGDDTIPVPLTSVMGSASVKFTARPENIWFQPRVWKVPSPSMIIEVSVERPSEPEWGTLGLVLGGLLAGIMIWKRRK